MFSPLHGLTLLMHVGQIYEIFYLIRELLTNTVGRGGLKCSVMVNIS